MPWARRPVQVDSPTEVIIMSQIATSRLYGTAWRSSTQISPPIRVGQLHDSGSAIVPHPDETVDLHTW
jgi:hypothetical protein